MNRTVRVLCAVATASLTACGGGGFSFAPKPGAGVPGVQRQRTSDARITIKIPHRGDPRAIARYLSNPVAPAGRSRHYLSPATQTIAIEVTGSGGSTTTVNATLSVTAPGSGPNPAECTSTALSTICTITLALAPGTYTGSFSTYDGPLGSNDAPTGNELSTNQNVPFTVAAGELNQLVVSLAAIPGSVTILPDASEKLVRGNATNGFALSVSHFVHKFDVFAQDADGDIIIGPGAPTFASSVTGTNKGIVTVVDPKSTAPNAFTVSNSAPLTPAFPNPKQFPSDTFDTTLTMTATPPAGAGVTCSAATCALTVGLLSNNLLLAGGGLLGQSGATNLYVQGEQMAYLNEGAAESVVADANGDIFFGQSNLSVFEWKPPYDVDPVQLFTTPNGGYGAGTVLDLTMGPEGNLYFDDGKTIYRSSPPYASATGIFFNNNFPIAEVPAQSRLLVDTHGVMIAADDTNVRAFNADGTGTAKTLGDGGSSITFDTAGELIASEPTAIESFTYDTTSGTYVTRATNTANNNVKLGPVRSAQNTIYIVDTANSRMLEFPVPLSEAVPTVVDNGVFANTVDFQPTLLATSVPAASVARIAGIASVDDTAGGNVTELFGFDDYSLPSNAQNTVSALGVPGEYDYNLTVIP